MSGSLPKKPAFIFLGLLALLFFLPLPAFAVIHTVNPGDTLFALCQRYGSDVETLKEVNGLKSDLIYPGQKIYIPK